MKANVKRLFAVLVAIGISAGVSLSTAAPAFADVEDFTFDSFDADLWLSRDADGTSTLRVVETLVAQFPETDQNHGIVRAIPDEYNGLPLETRIDSVVDHNGDAVYFEQDDEGDHIALVIGSDDDPYLHGEQTYVIEYTQHHVVRAFEDTGVDELYRDINGTGWAQPFARVSATFHIDSELEGALTGDASCYVGEEGATTPCDISPMVDAAGPVFQAEASNLGPGETVTAAIAFTAGTFVVPDPPRPAAWAVVLPIIVMVVIGLLAIVAAVVRMRAPRDAAGRGTIIPEYSVPEENNLFVAGNVVARTATAVPAAMIALAVRGNIQIVDAGKDDYSVRFLGDTDTDKQEVDLLAALFGATRTRGDVRSLKKPSTTFATALRAVATGTRARVLELGLREKVRWVPSLVVLWITVAVFPVAVVLFVLNLALSPAPSLSGILVLPAAIVGVVVSAICAYIPAVLTDEGATMRDYVKGLRVYLTLAEADRFRMLQSPGGALRIDVDDTTQVVRLYEKLLPYAVLWGVERQWADELAVRYEATAPTWYVGSSGFNPALFGASLHSFSQTASTAASYSASTGGSTSGGSMGGGSAGGGGGGGGGGGH